MNYTVNAVRRRRNQPSPLAPDPVLVERASRLRSHCTQRPPRSAIALVTTPEAVEAALPLLVDRVQREHAAPLQTVRLYRHGIPSVIFNPESGGWYCAAGYADGRSVLSLAMWMRDCATLSALAFLLAANPMRRTA